MRHQMLHGIVGSLVMLAAMFGMMRGNRLEAAELQAETIKEWTAYVNATERRIAREIQSGGRFLALDFQSASERAEERSALFAGEVPVTKMKVLNSRGKEIVVAGGMVYHWRGSIFIPGIELDDVLSKVANPGARDTRQEDVLESTVLERGPNWLKIYLKLRRSKVVTVVYNTEHLVSYRRYSGARASSRSVAVKIAELENPNSAEEREKPQGVDRGFLWRLNSYWRYAQVDGGVLVECESVSLSRTVPTPLKLLIRSSIHSTARQSMKRTLSSLRDHLMKARHQRDLTSISNIG